MRVGYPGTGKEKEHLGRDNHISKGMKVGAGPGIKASFIGWVCGGKLSLPGKVGISEGPHQFMD